MALTLERRKSIVRDVGNGYSLALASRRASVPYDEVLRAIRRNATFRREVTGALRRLIAR